MKFSIFSSEKYPCILHGQVFVMLVITNMSRQTMHQESMFVKCIPLYTPPLCSEPGSIWIYNFSYF